MPASVRNDRAIGFLVWYFPDFAKQVKIDRLYSMMAQIGLKHFAPYAPPSQAAKGGYISVGP